MGPGRSGLHVSVHSSVLKADPEASNEEAKAGNGKVRGLSRQPFTEAGSNQTGPRQRVLGLETRDQIRKKKGKTLIPTPGDKYSIP